MKTSKMDYWMVIVFGVCGALNALQENYVAAAFAVVIMLGVRSEMSSKELIGEYKKNRELQRKYINDLEHHIND